MSHSWAYGITTVPKRKDDLLPRTLESLRRAGFDQPRLFVDGSDGQEFKHFGLPITAHYPPLLTAGKWFQSLGELFIRNPSCTHFAMFQDDFVTYRNLRGYLDRCRYPNQGYMNLFTFPDNQRRIPLENGDQQPVGWHKSNQRGLGAVALVFDRDAVVALLQSKDLIERPLAGDRGWTKIDGGIVTCLSRFKIEEYIHNPTLVQHTGLETSLNVYIPNKAPIKHPLSESFLGEDFDAMELLSKTTTQVSEQIKTALTVPLNGRSTVSVQQLRKEVLVSRDRAMKYLENESAEDLLYIKEYINCRGVSKPFLLPEHLLPLIKAGYMIDWAHREELYQRALKGC